ncbi:hypothetical protein GeomeDRAFT_3347 [Geobacter metallireducens RCH3]|uniref:Uncharacterized protein n=1 Tax=Geobacter metallireducens (strain ATCC 53774 / DSM 7210 / GS-15) TaxID=269799 RepID=Q39PQ1_GEOMG|nr:hypothetical protein [Geobacter metallireducens]ABB33773.1 hypothetical protein Gmet_A3568 [Geobacter metallireducens GS-15]EHP83962.1 hypothetical protein GeomeDRAFT_3347 [Geobacter metallireducens RCH3]
MANTETIDYAILQRLIEAGAIRGAEVIGQPGGWSVIFKYGMTERALGVRGGKVRIFRKIETLVAYLRELGIVQFTVNAANYDPTTTIRPGRPDTSERMKRAFAVAQDIKEGNQ